MGAGPWDSYVLTGGPITLDLRDYAHRHIYFFGQIEPHITALARQRFRAGWTMLDVGANAGYHSALCSDLGARRIVAFEPNPRLYPLLARTAAQHPEMTIERAAVGEASGRGVLRLSGDPGNTGLSTLGWNGDHDDSVEVRIVALDDYCREHGIVPDFIKISVMGHEQRVLEGMNTLVEQRVPRVVVSELTTRRADPVAVVSRFEEAGYGAYAMTIDGDLTKFHHRAPRADVCFILDR